MSEAAQSGVVSLEKGGALKAFYERRYIQGYMEDWPAEKKRRVEEIVGSLRLPSRGMALDYGCGNGVLTDVLRRALPPDWKVSGMDISPTAVRNARARYPQCEFFQADEYPGCDQRVSLLFTHHVLEHVSDLDQTLDDMSSCLREDGWMFHILPCGNPGSLEHRICTLRAGGVETERGGRFFYEEDGHLRRLTSERLSELCQSRGFRLEVQQFGNQEHGAVEWLSSLGPRFLFALTDESAASCSEAVIQLRGLRRRLLALWALRLPAMTVEAKLRKVRLTPMDWLWVALGLAAYPFSKGVDWSLKQRALNEWRSRRQEPNGSEMYLVFRQIGAVKQ